MPQDYDYRSKNIKKIKVSITTITQQTIWGYVWCFNRQRVQDILNDDRAFLPIEIINQHTGSLKEVLYNKDQIAALEEIQG